MNHSQPSTLGFHLWKLLGFSILGTMASQVLGSAIIRMEFGKIDSGSFFELAQSQPEAWAYIKGTQVIHTVLAFGLPSWIVWRQYSGGSNFSYPAQNRSTPWAFLLIPILLFTFYPLAQFLYSYNQSIQFPEPMHTTLLEMERQMELMIEGMLADRTWVAIVSNFLIIGVLAAVFEEVFFRGVFQRILSQHIDIHLAIFISAFVFSTIHMQFFGFLPRLALGILFGYMYWHTQRLLIPIFAHFLFNSTQLASYYYFSSTEIGSEQATFPISATIASILLFSGLYFIFYHFIIKNSLSENVSE